MCLKHKPTHFLYSYKHSFLIIFSQILSFDSRQACYRPQGLKIKEHSSQEERHMLYRRPGLGCAARLRYRYHRHRPQSQSGHQKVMIPLQEISSVLSCAPHLTLDNVYVIVALTEMFIKENR